MAYFREVQQQILNNIQLPYLIAQCSAVMMEVPTEYSISPIIVFQNVTCKASPNLKTKYT